MMTDAIIAATLAFAAESYSSNTESPIVQTVSVNVKPAVKRNTIAKKGSTPKAQDSHQPHSPKNLEPGPKSDPLPIRGTIKAQEFLASLPHCGKRPNANGVRVFQNNDLMRDDEKRLVASFVGWDPKEIHGVQLEAARRQARRDISPVSAKAFSRGADPSLTGTVAGMPNVLQTKIDNLLAREKASAEAISDNERKASLARGKADHDLFMGLAALESQRIKQIRKELIALKALSPADDSL